MQQNAIQTAKTVALAPSAATIRQPVLRRKCECGQHTAGGECEECKKKKTEEKSSGDPLLQRAALSRNPMNAVPGVVNTAMQQQGRTMEGGIRSRLESSFRCDLSRVRVHSDESAARAASAINARAFTLGQNIWFGRNEFAPNSVGGFHLLAHEVAHTIQQGAQTPAVQRSLAVGAVDDPAEAAADRAADAASRSASAPQLGNSQAVIRRAPTGKFPLVEDKGPDKKRVSLDEHTTYIIERTLSATPQTEHRKVPPKVGAGADFGRAWVCVEWCQDRVRGQVAAGLDVRNELNSIVPQLVQAASRGDEAGVKSVLQGATVTPFLNVLVAKSENWQVNAKVEADVGRGGAREERLTFKLQTRVVNLSVGGNVTQTPTGADPGVFVRLEVPLEKAPRTFTCKTKQKTSFVFNYSYVCWKEPSPPKPESPAKLDPREREIFFCWAKTDLNKGKCVPGPRDKGKESADKSAEAAAKNQQNLKDLRADFGDRYRLTTVTGYTSAEGPEAPAGKFPGNEVLRNKRAEEALSQADLACFPRKPELCFPGGLKGVTKLNGGQPPGHPAESEYPLQRKATLHLEPPLQPTGTDAPHKPNLQLPPKDYVECPAEVIRLAFRGESPPKKEDVTGDPTKDQDEPCARLGI